MSVTYVHVLQVFQEWALRFSHRGIPYQQFRVAKHNAVRHKNIHVG